MAMLMRRTAIVRDFAFLAMISRAEESVLDKLRMAVVMEVVRV